MRLDFGELTRTKAGVDNAAAADDVAADDDEVDRITLAQGDATADGALPRGTSHVWLANTCFLEGLTRAVLAAIVARPNLRCVVALQPLPLPPPGDACGLELVATRLLRMSWSDVPARFYCCKRRS